VLVSRVGRATGGRADAARRGSAPAARSSPPPRASARHEPLPTALPGGQCPPHRLRRFHRLSKAMERLKERRQRALSALVPFSSPGPFFFPLFLPHSLRASFHLTGHFFLLKVRHSCRQKQKRETGLMRQCCPTKEKLVQLRQKIIEFTASVLYV